MAVVKELVIQRRKIFLSALGDAMREKPKPRTDYPHRRYVYKY